MNQEYRQALKYIQNLQKTDPYDAGHDFEHHQTVVNNCQSLVKAEKLKVNEEVLELAAWWHDYQRDNLSKNNAAVKDSLHRHGFDDEFIKTVLDTINHHSHGNQQELTEQKVLYDADKIEYVNPERIKHVMNAVSNGNMSMQRAEKYAKVLNERVISVYESLHYDYSKQIFRKYAKELLSYIKVDSTWEDLEDNLKKVTTK